MKRLVAIFFFFLCIFLPRSVIASERITNFAADIVIDRNGTIAITERVTVDFGQTPHHGIYRTIPYRYTRNGSTYSLRINIVSVNDESSVPQETKTSRSGGELKLRIGDPDATVTGVKDYVISYSVQRAINPFSDHDELYWNITGNTWEYPIQKSSAIFSTNSTNAVFTDAVCYSGAFGAKEKDCTVTQSNGAINVLSKKELTPGEGITAAISIPKGTIALPSFSQTFWWFLQDNGVLFVPVVIAIILFLIWRRRGRDPKGTGTVIPQYEPPKGFLPGETGTLWDDNADKADISATIIDLAVKGYLKIKDLGKKNYLFTKMKDSQTLTPYEKSLFVGIFSTTSQTVELKNLKNKFYKYISDIQKGMYESLVEKGMYTKNPHTLRGVYYGIGAALIIGIFWLPGAFGGLPSAIALTLSGILFFLFGRIMPQKTVKGAKTLEEIKGFKWFLSVTEAERLKFFNAPEKKPEQFEKFLPYAMVLKVEKQWAAQFKDMMLQEPSWYQGQPGMVFNALVFANIMNSMSSNMNSSLASRPGGAGSGGSGFGGGGFSGGGFGGGGGGGW